MATLFIAGIFFIIEGGRYIDMKRQSPNSIPDKMYTAGVTTIVLGIISICFAILHFFIPIKIDSTVIKTTVQVQ
jgi:hypothetical protein